MTEEEIQAVVEKVLEKFGVTAKPHPDAPLPAQELFSIKTCAHIAGLSPCHIRRAVTGGTLKSSDVGTVDRPIYRIHRDDFNIWLVERQAGPKPPPPRKKAAPESKHHKQKKEKTAAKQSA